MISLLLMLLIARLVLNFILMNEKNVPIASITHIQQISSFGIFIFLSFLSIKSYTSYIQALLPLQIYLLLVTSLANLILSIILTHKNKFTKFIQLDIITIIIFYVLMNIQGIYSYLNVDILYILSILIYTFILLYSTTFANKHIYHIAFVSLLIPMQLIAIKLFAYELYVIYFIMLLTILIALYYYIKTIKNYLLNMNYNLPVFLSFVALFLLHLVNIPYNQSFDTLLNKWLDIKMFIAYIKIETVLILTVLHIFLMAIIVYANKVIKNY